MIDAIKRFFYSSMSFAEQESSDHKEHRLQLAAAALMFELLKTDRHIDDRETDMLRQVLQKKYALSDEELNKIIALAEEESRQSVSLYEFTSLINSNYSYEDRVELIRMLWQLALSDGHLDKYEEQMIRKTADLIYVSHSDFIRSKLDVRDGNSAQSSSKF